MPTFETKRALRLVFTLSTSTYDFLSLFFSTLLMFVTGVAVPPADAAQPNAPTELVLPLNDCGGCELVVTPVSCSGDDADCICQVEVEIAGCNDGYDVEYVEWYAKTVGNSCFTNIVDFTAGSSTTLNLPTARYYCIGAVVYLQNGIICKMGTEVALPGC